ncbi:MAG TPA: recombinase family protein [Symbiobacteriaceae bacterium]|nr:recombinase family protein [Symbiobacteriaceae bacterium]
MSSSRLSVVIYLRVSTEEQARKGFSLPDQRDACRARAKEIARGADVSGVNVDIQEFVDTFGGDVLERPVLEDLRTYVRINKPDWFICMDPDRFSRNLTAQLIATDEIEKAGTQLAFVQHNYEKTAEGRLFYQLRGAVAEFEKAKILERTARGKRRKLRDGGRSNGAAPFGYQHNIETDELAVYEPEAQWVRLMFQWVADEHLTFYQIVRRLRELGVATKKGGVWREATVTYILRNTTYVGQMVCNRYDSVGMGAYRRLPKNKREVMTYRERPESDWIIAPVPAIIEQTMFDTVQRLLETYGRQGPRNSYLLSALLRCGRCGSSMAYNKKRQGRNGPGAAYLRCNRRFSDLRHYADPTRCPMPHMRAEKIEQGIWETVCGWLVDPGLLEEYLQQHQSDGGPKTDQLQTIAEEIAVLEQQLADKQNEQVVIIHKQMKKLLTEKMADKLLATAVEQVEGLEARLAETRKRSSQLQAHLASLQDVRHQLQVIPQALAAKHSDIAAKLAQLNDEQRAELIRQVVRAVIINEDRTWTIIPY